MPITEVPTSTPTGSPEDQGTPPESRRSRRYADYGELGQHELLDVIGELRDDRARARLREMFWVSLIFHMVLFWYLAYGPRYIFHVRVVDPSKVLRDREKNPTYLDLPPDALKKIRPPKPTNIISDKDRVAQSTKPTLDKKTLQELEAMKRAGPPAPPVPKSNAPAAPPPPQVAQQQPQPQVPPAQPLPQNNNSQLEAPKPAPTQPNFQTGPANTRSALQEAMRQAMKGAGQGEQGGDQGLNAPSQHGGMSGAVDVLSDTMGVDFGPYIQRVIYDTKRAWYPIIPEAAQPPLLKQGRVAIRFRIYPDGSVKNMVLEGPSGDVSLDRAAWGGITGASPYQQLPKQFKGPFLELRFFFLYNLKPGPE
jgi:TonB family protein